MAAATDAGTPQLRASSEAPTAAPAHGEGQGGTQHGTAPGRATAPGLGAPHRAEAPHFAPLPPPWLSPFPAHLQSSPSCFPRRHPLAPRVPPAPTGPGQATKPPEKPLPATFQPPRIRAASSSCVAKAAGLGGPRVAPRSPRTIAPCCSPAPASPGRRAASTSLGTPLAALTSTSRSLFPSSLLTNPRSRALLLPAGPY